MTSPLSGHENELGRLQNVWESYARDDPLWAILSDPSKTGGKLNFEEFLQSGLFEIDQLFRTLSLNDIEFEKDSALDFGCGIGWGDAIRSVVDPQDTKKSANEALEGFSMHCIPRREVVAFLEQHGTRLEFIHPSDKGRARLSKQSLFRPGDQDSAYLTWS